MKNEFLAVEYISNIDDGKLRYDIFVKAYNETREHGGINGLTPPKMFLQRLITYTMRTRTICVSTTSNLWLHCSATFVGTLIVALVVRKKLSGNLQ